MTTLEYIYLACAIAGAIVFIARMVLMLVGGFGGAEGGMDSVGEMGDLDAGGVDDFDLSGADAASVDLDLDADAGGADFDNPDFSFRFLSLQGVSSFIMMFGIVGLAIAKAPISPIFSLIAGIAAGVLTVWVVSLIFGLMIRLQSDGTMRMQSGVGERGEVYLRIPANGAGKVRVIVQGALRVLDAVAADGQEIPTGSAVKVIAVRDTVFVVEPVQD
ncbi:MAG: NfeD family protein [Anaerolineaceae bacterium]|nr:NfeD family protein [Anaerolineaceae bacterium]